MKRRELSEDIIQTTEATPTDVVDLLQGFTIGECWENPFHIQGDLNDTSSMLRYIDALKQAGLDIGKGNSQFGYRMPLPARGSSTRILQIFRRN